LLEDEGDERHINLMGDLKSGSCRSLGQPPFNHSSLYSHYLPLKLSISSCSVLFRLLSGRVYHALHSAFLLALSLCTIQAVSRQGSGFDTLLSGVSTSHLVLFLAVSCQHCAVENCFPSILWNQYLFERYQVFVCPPTNCLIKGLAGKTQDL
jgi:hypothetical protein